MDNFEKKTKKCDSTLQIRPRTLQARFGEGKKGQGVEPTSSINYRNRALGELVGEKGGSERWKLRERGAERCGILRLTSPARLFLTRHDPAHAGVAPAGTALPSTAHAAVPPRPAVCAAFGLG